jgi:uncharacterized damage-inducible protein DinB
MEEQTDVNRFALEALRLRITKVFPDQIRSCLQELDEKQLWWRPNNESNSIANLVLHLRGSVLHFLYRGVGGMEYQRDRPTEFSTRAASKEELLNLFDDMVEKATRTFSELEPARLGEASTEPAYYSTVFEDLLGVVVHMATHTGQIVYLTKMLKEGSVSELWMKAHRKAGAWRT